MSTREDIYRYVIRFKKANGGISPTAREIADGVALSTTSIVNYHLNILAKNGRIAFPLGRSVARGIAVPGFEYTEAANDKETA